MTQSEINSDRKPDFSHLDTSEIAALGIVRAVGYGLIILTVLDWVSMLTPLNLMNPVWEFQTFGQIVERVPVPLIGLAMAFWGGFINRRRGEVGFLKLLSLLTLFLALVFYLLIPLMIANTMRLDKQNTTQIDNALKQQIAQVENFEQKIAQANREQINQLLRTQGINPSDKSLPQIKDELRSRVFQSKEQIKNQAQFTRNSRRMNLLKSSIKWNVGAVVAGTLFMYLWKATAWVRKG